MFKFVVFPGKFSKKKKSAEFKNEKKEKSEKSLEDLFSFFSSKFPFNNNQRMYN